MGQQDSRAVAESVIDSSRYMTLATADPDGQPFAAPVYFSHAQYTRFYWISAPEAQHSRNLAGRPQLGIVVFDSTVPSSDAQAAYIRATAEQVADADLAEALAAYPRPNDPEAGRMTAADVGAPGPYRMYCATAYEVAILCPRQAGRPCAVHGTAHDHRVVVE